MAKYKVLQKFKDTETGTVYKAGDVIEMTVKRANEAMKNLEKWNGDFLKRVEEKGEE